jgi:hypothetical protein
MILIDGPIWVFSCQPDLHTAKQSLQTIKLFFDWEDELKVNFFWQYMAYKYTSTFLVVKTLESPDSPSDDYIGETKIKITSRVFIQKNRKPS